jgi:hypothetical protein
VLFLRAADVDNHLSGAAAVLAARAVVPDATSAALRADILPGSGCARRRLIAGIHLGFHRIADGGTPSISGLLFHELLLG